ncbi:hypothetical protein NQ317_002774 [Molorchus minor]|uniref:Uncharacterized protein n=1 Tax=Molorchus minor TaxID=1323400 RepID=A0ABQ9JJG1_9CUCU|nr:hypothetical protein NQ317_002774 [Molorchus minor]
MFCFEEHRQIQSGRAPSGVYSRPTHEEFWSHSLSRPTRDHEEVKKGKFFANVRGIKTSEVETLVIRLYVLCDFDLFGSMDYGLEVLSFGVL